MIAPSIEQYPKCHYSLLFALLVLLSLLPSLHDALNCLDCVGNECADSPCSGDYCVLSNYAPRWGTSEWGQPQEVKGCMSGSLLRKDIRSHCEVAGENREDVFTCFCDNKDLCNAEKSLRRLEEEHVELLNCVCKGAHCRGPTCVGELCSYVYNYKTEEQEQGCVNASVPIIERRSAGTCMIPPITGAMHHTLAKTADDLLMTESCICTSDYCNKKKPKVSVQENMKCQAFVKAEYIGTRMESKEVSCTGEYCFKAKITSKIGHLSEYDTIGCASFIDGSELVEELNPVGCATFESENLRVESCIRKDDKRSVTETRKKPPAGKPTKTKPKSSYERESEEKEEREDEGKTVQNEEESENRRQTTAHYIFERPTLSPEVNENSNSSLVSVFLLLILLIILSGIVWKFQLHKRLFRASYDTVAGG